MYCRYCGKPIEEDSVFCKHCGKGVNIELNPIKVSDSTSNKIHTIISESKNNLTWENTVSYTKRAFIFLWKVLQSIFIVLGMIIIYTIMYAVMSPFIAMFNADVPSLGLSDRLVEIWKKKAEVDKENSQSD